MPLKPRFDMTVLTLHVDGGTCANVFHFRGPTTAPTTADLTVAANTASTAFAGALKPLMSAANRFMGVEIRYVADINSRYAASQTAAGPGAIGGADAGQNDESSNGQPAAAELAIIARKLGNGPVKNASGTTFLGCLDETMVTGSRPSEDFKNVESAVRNVILAPLTVGGTAYPAVVLSRKTDTMYDVQEVSFAPVVGNQRSRRPQR